MLSSCCRLLETRSPSGSGPPPRRRCGTRRCAPCCRCLKEQSSNPRETSLMHESSLDMGLLPAPAAEQCLLCPGLRQPCVAIITSATIDWVACSALLGSPGSACFRLLRRRRGRRRRRRRGTRRTSATWAWSSGSRPSCWRSCSYGHRPLGSGAMCESSISAPAQAGLSVYYIALLKINFFVSRVMHLRAPEECSGCVRGADLGTG